MTLEVRTTAAAGSDDLADTVDYGQVADAVHALIVGEPVDLIETLAERIAAACLAFPGVERVKVTVHKPHAPIEVPFDDVQLRIVAGAAAAMADVALALGSNMGDSAAILQGAVDDLASVDGISVMPSRRRTRPIRWAGPSRTPT